MIALPSAPPGRRTAPFDRLSPAEFAVALHIKHGLSNKEIASRLYKAESTVKKQVSSILSRLGIESRARIIALMHELAVEEPLSAAEATVRRPSVTGQGAGGSPAADHFRKRSGP